MGKRWLLLIAAVMMSIGFLAGCSGGDGGMTEDTMLQDPAAEDGGGAVTEEPAADPAADPAAETPEGDAGTDATTETPAE
ncbi:hypothetical protein [Paenibacillus thermotolerans]|uniref:hypothetical protein n=1 Tax=Paenibacillus thermotolerans TaxID=3027807 RepID=UPI002367DC6F|nr:MULTISPECIES: hypothetical protein [unclassified Paenibacillus]